MKLPSLLHLLLICGALLGPASSVSAQNTLFLDRVIAQEDVVLTSNVWYGEGEEPPGGAGKFYLDIYRPSNHPLPNELPTIIYLHGGNGNKEAEPAPSYCYEFARRGYVAIAVQYRVGNVNTAAGDVANAIRWVRENAARYKVDTDRILVGGHSFGGVISAELTVNLSDYFGADEGRIAAALLCAAALNQFPVNTSAISLEGPPIMIVHGLNDPIATVDGIRSLVTDLDNLTDPVNGTRYPYRYLEVPGAGHAFYPGTGSGITVPFIAGPIDADQGWSNTEIAGKAVADHVFEFFFEHLKLGGTGCAYSVTPPSTAFAATGSNANFTIQTDASCPWIVANLPGWITVSGASSGTGPGTVTLVATANPGGARNASVMIAGVSVTLTQPQSTAICTYALSLGGQSFSASGGAGGVDILTGPGCAWTASSQVSWVTLTSATSGSGAARVNFQVSNNTGAARTGALAIAGRSFTVEQSGTLSGPTSFAGALPQVASGGGWQTTYTITNTGTSSATVRLNHWANNGTELPLPMSFPQLAAAGVIQGTTIERTLDAGATLLIGSEAPATGPILEGWTELLSTGSVTAFAVFRLRLPDGREQEATVPLETRTATGYLLNFDNVAGFATGMAVANHQATAVNLTATIRDDAGRQISVETIPLPARGHIAFALPTRWTTLTNRRGTVEVRSTTPGFSILGLRFHPQGPFTTLPVAGR